MAATRPHMRPISREVISRLGLNMPAPPPTFKEGIQAKPVELWDRFVGHPGSGIDPRRVVGIYRQAECGYPLEQADLFADIIENRGLKGTFYCIPSELKTHGAIYRDLEKRGRLGRRATDPRRGKRVGVQATRTRAPYLSPKNARAPIFSASDLEVSTVVTLSLAMIFSLTTFSM